MSKNKKQKITWKNITLLEVEKNWKLRRIKEFLYINSFSPSNKIDASKLMNPVKARKLQTAGKSFIQ